MQTIQAVITGAIQGLSEFLPISSSAHIVFSHEICSLLSGTPINQEINQEEIFFDILVHLATLFAVVIYFFRDLKNICLEFFKSVKNKNYKNQNVKLVGYIALSVFITGIIGLLLKEKVEFLTANPQIVCFFLMGTGFILLFSEKMYKGNKKISLKTAILISIAQGLAVFPGFSRSGLTISTAIMRGMSRIEAAKFSFLMSIPVIFLASLVYPLMELDFKEIMTFNIKALLFGFVTSFIVGYLCIKYFMKLLGELSLKSFGFYCIGMSVVMFFVFQFFYHQ